jgi:hypothetical protein
MRRDEHLLHSRLRLLRLLVAVGSVIRDAFAPSAAFVLGPDAAQYRKYCSVRPCGRARAGHEIVANHLLALRLTRASERRFEISFKSLRRRCRRQLQAGERHRLWLLAP